MTSHAWNRLAVISAGLLALPACTKSPLEPGPGDGGGGGGGGAAERTVIERMFGDAFRAGATANESVDLAVFAVFTASGLNGGTPTFTGTLTQAGAGSNTFSYSAAPADRLVVLLSGAPGVDVRIAAFEGNRNGTWQDFRDHHTNLDIEISRDGVGELSIRSTSVAARRAAAPSALRQVNRSIAGTLVDGGVPLDVDLAHTGSVDSWVDGSYSSYETNEALIGTIRWSGGQIEVDESYAYLLAVDGSRDVQNMHRWNRSSGQSGGTSFAFDGVYVRSEHVNSRVNRPEYWLAQGSLTRNGATHGTVRLESAPSAGTQGPEAMLVLAGGETIRLGGTLR